MLKFLFLVGGLVFGAFWGFPGALAGGLIGLALSIAVSRTERVPELEAELARLGREVAQLQARQSDLEIRLKSAPAAPRPPAAPAQEVPPVASTTPVPTVMPVPAAVPGLDEVELERQALAALEAEVPPPPPPIPPLRAPSSPVRPTPREDFTLPEPTEFKLLQMAQDWLLGGNTLVRVGAVVLFFGLAFLVKFAAEHTRLPIEFRYMGIGLSALAFLALGWRLRESRPGYAMSLQGLAVAVLYLTVFAAFRLHQLLPGALTFALLVALCALSAALAVLQDARAMAVMGICGGFLAPVLASTGGGSHVALFSYYALLNGGIFGIAWFKAWRSLNVLGFLFTFGVGSVWGYHNYQDELFASTEAFLLLFFAFYVAISVLYALRRKDELEELAALHIAGQRIDYVDGSLVFGTPLAAFGLQTLLVRHLPYGSAFSALALGLLYLPLAAWLYRRGKEEMRLLVESFLALGVGFASIAIPLGLDARWTAAAWAAEGAGILWVGLRQERPVARGFGLLLQLGAGLSFLHCLHTPGQAGLFGLTTVLAGPVFSALLVAAAGLASTLLLGRHREDLREKERRLDSLTVLWTLGFITIIFPLLLDLRWSGVSFAVVGLMSLAAGRNWLPATALAAGALLQLCGGLGFLGTLPGDAPLMPILNGPCLGALAISAAGFLSGLMLYRHGEEESDVAPGLAGLGLAWSLLWWWQAGTTQIDYFLPDSALAARILFAAASALLLLDGARRLAWPATGVAAALLLPLLLIFGGEAFLTLPQPTVHYGWLAWPLALVVLARVLRRQEGGPIAHFLDAAHILSLWLVGALLSWQSWWWFRELGEPGSAWPVLGWALAPLFLLTLINSEKLRSRWPLANFLRSYTLGALPLALGLWLWVFIANGTSTGSAAPLPYLPLLNPLDLATAASLMVLLIWLRSALEKLDVPAEQARTLIAAGLGATAFFWLNGMLLRSLHHWAGVPFDITSMLQSTLVQAALSLFWALLALSLMLFATRRSLRPLWLTGGNLMAAVVLKLFLVDLSRVGTVERIVSFIGVGLLLLVLGYFSPMPPRREEEE